MDTWDVFFKIFLTSKEIFFSFYEVIPQNIFNNPIQTNLLILAQKFADKYKKVPDFDTLKLLLDNLPDSEKENKQAYVDFVDKVCKLEVTTDLDAFSDQLTKTIQDYEVEQFILKTANKVGKVTLEEMVEDIRVIMNKFTPKSVGVDVTDVNRAIKYIRHDTTSMTPSGIEELDKVLRGGYGSNEITIMMAPPGKGKSFFLINAMYYAMLTGRSVLYVTLELGEKSVVRRLYSRLSFANRKDMLEEEVIAKRANKFFKLVNTTGRVIYYPGMSLTVTGIESLLEQQLLYFGFKPDVLIVDYLDRLAPRKADYKSEVRHQLRNITDDLRSVAMRHNISVLTACLTGDTKIRTLEGKIPIKDLVGRKDVSVWCYDLEQKKITIGRVTECFLSNPSAPVYEITIDNGRTVRATANHPFLLRNGEYAKVDDLKPGDSLMPFIKVNNPTLDPVNVKKRVQTRIENDAMLTLAERRARHKPYCKHKINCICLSCKSKRGERHTINCGRTICKQRRGERAYKLAPRETRTCLCGCGEVFVCKVRSNRRFSVSSHRHRINVDNHKVVSVKFIGKAPVYNLTVDKYHNFALDAGVIVKNTQANRASLSKLKITEANVSESFGKIEVADVILALCQTDDERAAKRGRLVVLKNREHTSGSTLEFYIDFDKMMLSDLASAQKLGLIDQPKQITGIRTRQIGEQ